MQRRATNRLPGFTRCCVLAPLSLPCLNVPTHLDDCPAEITTIDFCAWSEPVGAKLCPRAWYTTRFLETVVSQTSSVAKCRRLAADMQAPSPFTILVPCRSGGVSCRVASTRDQPSRHRLCVLWRVSTHVRILLRG